MSTTLEFLVKVVGTWERPALTPQDVAEAVANRLGRFAAVVTSAPIDTASIGRRAIGEPHPRAKYCVCGHSIAAHDKERCWERGCACQAFADETERA
jgi:hypothetical protein